jgi:hypothetical protein
VQSSCHATIAISKSAIAALKARSGKRSTNDTSAKDAGQQWHQENHIRVRHESGLLEIKKSKVAFKSHPFIISNAADMNDFGQ